MRKNLICLLTAGLMFVSSPVYAKELPNDLKIPQNRLNKEIREKIFLCEGLLDKDESQALFYCRTKNDKGNFAVIYPVKESIQLEKESNLMSIVDLKKCYIAEDKNKDGDPNDKDEQAWFGLDVCKKKFKLIQEYLSH